MGYCRTRTIFYHDSQLLVSTVLELLPGYLTIDCFFLCSRGAQGALLVYDVTVRESFEHVINWYERARQLGGEDLELILIGNKVDLPIFQRQVSQQEGEALSRELGNIPFVETSALNGSNVENAFVTMTRNIKKSVDRRGLTGVKSKNMLAAGGVQLSTKEAPISRRCGCS
jgi:hypothetical protein